MRPQVLNFGYSRILGGTLSGTPLGVAVACWPHALRITSERATHSKEQRICTPTPLFSLGDALVAIFAAARHERYGQVFDRVGNVQPEGVVSKHLVADALGIYFESF